MNNSESFPFFFVDTDDTEQHEGLSAELKRLRGSAPDGTQIPEKDPSPISPFSPWET